MNLPTLSEKLGTLTLSRFHFKTRLIRDGFDGQIKRIAMSTVSGKAVLIDREIWEKIENCNFSEIPEETLGILQDAKILVDKKVDEWKEILEENCRANDSPETLKVVIQPTDSCQLGCVYCGQTHGNTKIHTALQQSVIKRVAYQLHKGGRKTLDIAWFGAEPLMGMDVIRALTPKLRALAENAQVAYTAKVVTNGVQLSSSVFAELTQELGVQRIEVTLDGTRSVHDQRRPTKRGSGSFDRIFGNLSEIFARNESKKIITVRCNVDKTNVSTVSELIDKIESIGGKENLTHFYVAPVHDWGNNASTGMSAKEFADFETEILAHLLQRGFKPAILPIRITSTCVATHKDCELIDAYGEIHKCTETPYVKAYESGNPQTKTRNARASGTLGRQNAEIDAAHECNPTRHFIENLSNYLCHKCFLFPSCGGACPKQWLDGHTPCPSTRFNLEKRLFLALAAKRLNTASQVPEAVSC